MKQKHLLLQSLLWVGILLTTSCSKKEKILTGITIEKYKAELVSKDMAISIAKHIPPQKYPTTKTANGQQGNSIIERPTGEVEIIYDYKNNPALYLVPYTNDSGFTIISGEVNYGPICAYVSKGSIQKGEIPGGLALWLKTTVEHVEIVRKGLYNNTANAKSNWKQILKEQTQIPNYVGARPRDPIDPNPPVEPNCESPYYTVQKGPFIATTWGQGCSYNGLVPFTCTANCGFAPTGCVATSMAQIIRFWQPTNNYGYNYGTMPNTFGNGEVERLMSDAGASVNMNYACAASGAYTADVPPALINNFGFASADEWRYNYFDVLRNIDNGWPLILS